MSDSISKIKAEIKEWQRAYRRVHGRDPGKDELRKNPEMQAKYKLWQESLRSDGGNATITSTVKQASQEGNTAVTPPKRAPKLLVPKQMPVQSTSTGPATPFSARKKLTRERESPISPPSEQPSHPNPFSQSRGKQHGTVVVPVRSASKPTASSQSSRIIPFDSSSSARHRTFPAFPPNLLNSDSDDDDNPFAAPDPISPTRSRRASQLITPSKSALRHQGSSAVSTPSSIMKKCSTNLELSPTRPKHLSGTALPMMTPRTKARKRMRGEEVPATPGDKRRKLGLATTDKALVVFGESSGRGMKRLTPEDEDDEDDEEIVNSPKKKSALAANGRVFTNMFDETSSAAASTRDDETSLRSTPPPPPSESGDSHAPEWDAHDSSDEEPSTALNSNSRGKPLFSVAPGKWTQDTWDAPTPGTDLSHLRKGLAKAGAAVDGKSKATKQPQRGSQPNRNQDSKKVKEEKALSNPFELLPPMPGEETAQPRRRYENGEPRSKVKGKVSESSAVLKKRAKEAAKMEEDEQSDDDTMAEVDEVAWRPYGPLRPADSATLHSSMPNSQATAPDLESEEQDPTESLPSELRALLSIQATRREDIKAGILARDVLVGRSTRGGDVWGIGDVEDDQDDGEGERDDWDSEPEGWTGRVEM